MTNQARPSISLCMIVRDEERTLGRCLDSLRGAFDELCLVDTGSTDRTLEIARQAGARIAEIPWNDSFAEARNHSLELATGEWILVVDADETLAEGGAEVLRRVAGGAFDRAETKDACAVHTLGAMARLVDHADGEVRESWVLRFFRNLPDHRYVGAIHNRLAPAFNERAEAPDAHVVMRDDLVIEHTGYSREVWARKGKTERTLRLYQRALRDDPDDLYTRYKHADFLRGLNDPATALAALDALCDRIAALPPEEQGRFAWHGEVFALCALEQLAVGSTGAATRRIAQGRSSVRTANLCYVEGVVALHTGRFDEALLRFAECRQIEGPARLQPPAPGVATWKSALGMVQALHAAGRGREAEALRLEAAEAYPECDALRNVPITRAAPPERPHRSSTPPTDRPGTPLEPTSPR